jgi:imidazole glycerol phosphate synthase glutamine amidotransferase subunit
MMALHKHNLVQYLQSAALQGRPIMGLCLGMQLLASSSTEHGLTSGLDLIPGQVLPMQTPRWHIGWNLITCQTSDPLFQQSEGETFYFNHSYYFQGPSEYQVCISASPDPFASIIRRGQVVGMQFHPEKSQAAGRKLLKTVIDGLVHA